MIEFYQTLGQEAERTRAQIKAEALRQTQLAMLEGRVRIEENQIITSRGDRIPFPEGVTPDPDLDLGHPHYWSAFTLIGSPW
jgi:CHAT domain-containing protein